VSAADRPLLPGSALSLLVGRDRELGVLRDHLTTALNGQGSLVLISGEAGIGKTSLAEVVCREAADRDAVVLVGRCYDLTETPPYGPWVEAFGRYQRAVGGPPLPEAFARRGTLGTVTSQAALFQQVLDFFLAVAAQRSVTLFLDDLQWADPASLELLRFVARNVFSLPLLLIVTYRTDELTRRHPFARLLPTLVRESSATRVALHSLQPDDLATLIRARYALPGADATRLVAYLAERAEGNPFFLSELLHTLEEEAVLRQVHDRWVLSDVTEVQVPPLLLQVLDARVARLGDDAQALLAVAAVIGQEVPLAVWARVADVGEETLVGVTERAVEAYLIRATSTSIRFVHALIREALYESIVPPRRQGWHRRVGEALVGQPTPDPDAVAYHFQQANDARAVDWLIEAGERARRTLADLAAIDRFERALALLDLVHEHETPRRAWLLARLAIACNRYDPRQTAAHLAAAAQIAVHLDDPVLDVTILGFRGGSHFNLGDVVQGIAEMRATRAALDALSPGDRQRMIYLLGAPISRWRGTHIPNLAYIGHLHEAVTLVQQEAPPDLTSEWFRGLACAEACLGDPERADAHFQRARDLDRAARDFWRLGGDYLVYLLYLFPYRVDNLPERQRRAEEGQANWEDVRRILPDLQQPQMAWLPLLFVAGRWEELANLIPSLRTPIPTYHEFIVSVVGPFARLRGDVTGAWQRVREMLPEGPATAPGGTMFVVGQQMQRLAAALSLDGGDLPTAKAWLEAHDRWLEWSGAILGQAEGQALWAEYYGRTGDNAQAAACAARSLALATEPRQPLALLAAHRLLGELATDARQYDDATRHLDASLRLADACQALYERALTLLALAHLRAATDAPETARSLLDEARAICLALGATPALVRVDALATRLSGMKDAPPVYPAGLSAREVDVLRLVATGLSNAEIAERLFVSVRTVETHIRGIYTKLGTSSRSVATRFAIEHDLA
jgi:DNA-binding CsgD family transcriptional regulator/tetratricopeptide (TPR) repeat protein